MYCLKRKINRYIKKEPLEHQLECINTCVDYFNEAHNDGEDDIDISGSEDNNEIDDSDEIEIKYNQDRTRGYIEMACGSGKSLTSFLIDKKLNNKITLVLVPSFHLLSQFFSDRINQSYTKDLDIEYVLVGSDADVDDEIKDKQHNGLILTIDYITIRRKL